MLGVSKAEGSRVVIYPCTTPRAVLLQCMSPFPALLFSWLYWCFAQKRRIQSCFPSCRDQLSAVTLLSFPQVCITILIFFLDVNKSEVTRILSSQLLLAPWACCIKAVPCSSGHFLKIPWMFRYPGKEQKARGLLPERDFGVCACLCWVDGCFKYKVARCKRVKLVSGQL